VDPEPGLSDDDHDAIERQLGRRLRGGVRVAVRCGCGLPAVIETHPIVDGQPFPTLYWLTCRRAVAAAGRLEADGRMRDVNERLASDLEFRAAFDAATTEYIARRDALHPLPDAGGVGGGPSDRVKCLHAHLAHHLACGGNPVGGWVLEQIGDVLHPPRCV
jgi:uncharacterized protein